MGAVACDDAADQVRELVRALLPTPSAGSLVPGPANAELVEQSRTLLGSGPVEWAVEVSRATALALVENGFDALDAPVREIEDAVEAALVALLLQLAGHRADSPFAVAEQAVIVRHRVSHATPFRRVPANLRLAQHHWVDLLLETAVRTGCGPAAMRTVVTTLERYFDRAVDWHLTHYLAEQERFLHGAAARRGRLIEQLVAGEEPSAAEIRALLGVHLEQSHLALVLDGADHHVQDALAALGDRSAGADVVRHQPATGGAWLWLSGPRAPAALPSALAAVAGVRTGIGSARLGAGGFRRSHVEALDALRYARQTGSAVARHADIALVTLLSTDPERARWFVIDHLGGLAAPTAAAAELRRTLAEYFRCGSRLIDAASALHIHRNTLVHRLGRVTKLLGHPVGEAAPEVQCALLLAEHLGDAVLAP